MRLLPSINEIRAAHALSVAMADGTQPLPSTLDALGLPRSVAKRFRR